MRYFHLIIEEKQNKGNTKFMTPFSVNKYQGQSHRTQQKTSKNTEIHGQLKKQVSTTRPELYKTHSELQYTK